MNPDRATAGSEHLNPLLAAFKASGLSIDELWIGFCLRGGRSEQYRLLSHLEGVARLSASDHNLVVDTINESLGEQLLTSSAVPTRS